MFIYEKQKFKIILIGNSNVGKTSIVNKFRKLNVLPKATIGTEFCQKEYPEKNQILQIWDCAGQEKYRALTRLYYKNIQGCIFIFDLSDLKSLTDMKDYWIETVIKYNTICPIFILVGNKCDLEKDTDYDLIEKLVKDYNMKYIETSVILNKNINEIFDSMSFYLNDNSIPEYKENNILINRNDNYYLNNMYGWC